MLVPAFNINLNNSILSGLAAVAKYDGEHPCLTCATSAGKIFIHSPHQRSLDMIDEIKFLNINRRITAMAVGKLDPEKKGDVLCVGSATNLLCYDVEQNSDVFFKDVPDGIMSMAIGNVGTVEEPICLVGGNCSLQGFDKKGEEQFWTVTGDVVSSLCLLDVDDDGQLEILVGTEDYEIRIFQNEEIISELTENERVTDLCNMRGTRYGFALANGTVGVYDKTQRVWRVKAKHQVTTIEGFDLDADGVPELISGWSNGRLEVRAEANGEVIYKDQFTNSIASVLRADYRMDGHEEVLAMSVDGELRGYLPASGDLRENDSNAQMEEQTLRELAQRRAELQYELTNLDTNIRLAQVQVAGKETHNQELVPPRTTVGCDLVLNAETKCIEAVLAVTNDTVIKSVVIFAEQLFEGESYVYELRQPAAIAKVPLLPPRDVAVDMDFKVLCGQMGASTYHVFEFTKRLPKFSMYLLRPQGEEVSIKSEVTFEVNERVPRFVMWMNHSFNIDFENVVAQSVDVLFSSLRNDCYLRVKMVPDNGGTVTIATDDMGVAGDVVQDLCAFLDIQELESRANFPSEMDQLHSLLKQVDGFNAVRLKLTVDMADSANAVKNILMRAEDSRLMHDFDRMKTYYRELRDLNGSLLGEYMQRTDNHEKLLDCLKEVNTRIQKAARLRVGHAKTRVVASCRKAIKANNIAALFKIIQVGHSDAE